MYLFVGILVSQPLLDVLNHILYRQAEVELVEASIGLLQQQGLFVLKFVDDGSKEHLGVGGEVLAETLGECSQYLQVGDHDVDVRVVD